MITVLATKFWLMTDGIRRVRRVTCLVCVLYIHSKSGGLTLVELTLTGSAERM